MKSIVIVILLCSTLTLLDAVALYYLKISKYGWYIAATIYSFLILPLLSYIFTLEGFGLVNFFWNTMNVVVMFYIGIYIFKEKIHYIHYIALTVIFVGICLMQMADFQVSK
jgi:multidrug transporter EmrE-like cation transporter